ncbi:hypothetical protein FA15DRAFT_675075 [Coprinopsis marcescibilis]|uniref:Mug135-like C-terminal domain-containing protein n=1 Tax=Coprinopsis marcescibilis TaxID=230819 RepID=A0A5C3KFA8_COPMA|nr:hypothetical protein FA15DRAFT_675075 [Coprinopsis marcescibilis]
MDDLAAQKLFESTRNAIEKYSEAAKEAGVAGNAATGQQSSSYHNDHPLDAAPVWFQDFRREFDDFRRELGDFRQKMEEDINTLKAGVSAMQAKMDQSEAVAFNRHYRADASAERPWRVVPFNDGTHPVDSKNLPALTTRPAAEAFTTAQLKMYEEGYGIYRPNQLRSTRVANLIEFVGGV